MQNSIEDHDLLSLIEDLPMSGNNTCVLGEFWKGLVLFLSDYAYARHTFTTNYIQL
jgi:hypothetical protein